jgi:hypothetical protein
MLNNGVLRCVPLMSSDLEASDDDDDDDDDDGDGV